MRRTAAGTAATLFAVLAIGGPLAGSGAAAPPTLHCAVATPPAACAHLDELAAQLSPIAPLLGADLASLVAPVQGFAARSDSSTGVPTGEVVLVSTALRNELGALPDGVVALLGSTVLGDLTGTLDALVAELTAPVAGQKAAGTSKPTPAKTAPAAPKAAPRSADASAGGTASTGGSGGAPSSSSVPDVPVGDPLLLAPLGMPDFGFSQTFEPAGVADVEVAPAAAAQDAQEVLADALEGDGPGAELAVVVVLSLLLIGGAGVAQLQAQRHTIPD